MLPAGVIRVGVEAAGHYHRPLAAASVWPGWEVVELNPAHVTEQRRVMGRRRVKTDALDLEAITELLLAGRGVRSVTEPPRARRADGLGGAPAPPGGDPDRDEEPAAGPAGPLLPGLTLALPDVLGTKVGRLVAEHFADPHRLAALGAARFVRFAAARGLQVRRPVADRLVAAARDALPTPDAAVARQVLAADLALLAGLDEPDAGRGDPDGGAAAGQPVRAAAVRARLGRGAGRQLRRRGR